MSKLGKCKGSFAQWRKLNIEKLGVGARELVLRHPECDCNTGCRRVTLWHPRPKQIELTDDWTVKLIARVRWGDGCMGPEVEVDWKHGVILDLSGCYDEVSFEIIEINGTAPDNPKAEQVIRPGDLIELFMPGGGGFGPPAERDPALRARDRLEGYVTA